MNEFYDVLVIGGGPVGLFATFCIGMRGLKCAVVESLPFWGGRLQSIFPEKHVYDVPGYAKIKAHTLAQNLLRQAERFHPTMRLSTAVLNVEKKPEGFWVQTSSGVIKARSVIIAAGIGEFEPQRLNLPEAQRYEGQGLSYGVATFEEFCGKDVVVAGGGDSALDWAHEFIAVAKTVRLVHRSARFRAHEGAVQRLQARGVPVHTHCEIAALEGKSGLENIVLLHKETGEKEQIATNKLLVQFGFKSELPAFTQWNIETDAETGDIITGFNMATSQQGLFAIGDVAQYPGKLKLMATGFSEAAMAAAGARAFLYPNDSSEMLHSTLLLEGK